MAHRSFALLSLCLAVFSLVANGPAQAGELACSEGCPQACCDEGCCPHCGDSECWNEACRYCFEWLPSSLLWEVPLANQREPRLYAKFANVDDQTNIDTAIGGQAGLLRWSAPGRTDQGIQLDGFAVVFTRLTEIEQLEVVDYRAGLPLTFRRGPWQAKLAYEHTSTHLGDEYIEETGELPIAVYRDEVVLGLARDITEPLRIYGQAGFTFAASDILDEEPVRFDWGIEWSRCEATTRHGAPFAAFDMDLRPEHDYEPNTTFQVGWQWRRLNSTGSARVALEVYNGRSPYGQFLDRDEDWVGAAIFYDW